MGLLLTLVAKSHGIYPTYDLKWFKMNTMMNSTIGIRGWVVKHGIPYKNHWSIAIILIFK